MWGIFKKDSVSEAVAKIQSEALKGDQYKLDKNKNGKLDKEDFKKLRKEETEQVEEGWDDMLKSVKDKNGPQPNGGSGKKQGTRYGGGKQKEDEAHERKEKKNESVELEEGTVKTSKYSWGTMKHVEHGHSFSIPLHPEHHQAIHNLKDGESHSFTDETKSKWKATREGDKVHFHGASRGNDSYKTTVKHDDLKEEVQLEELEDGTFYDGSDMLGEAKERTSGSYQFTHTPGDAESEKKLADLKAQHKGTGKRVVLQGRLGKNNPNAHKYSKANFGKPGSASSGAHTHQRIKKADAAHHDVYVYDKADTEYNYDEMISEVLSKDQPAGKWISDFIKSDNPKFAGDSKEKRKQRALAAYYSAKKNESTDYNFFAEYIEEAAQKEVIKMGAKEIKHANMKDKQQHAEIMEPHSKGEADFINQHSILVTDDPTASKQDCGAGTKATEPKGQGAGKYDGESKLNAKDKATFKEAVIKGDTTEAGSEGEDIDTEPKQKDTKENNSKKSC